MVFDRWNLWLKTTPFSLEKKNTQRHILRYRERKAKRNLENTTFPKGKISKEVFLVKRISELHLRKEKPVQVVFKASFQYIGIIGTSLYLTSA